VLIGPIYQLHKTQMPLIVDSVVGDALLVDVVVV
jgi:hypothetical protein